MVMKTLPLYESYKLTKTKIQIWLRLNKEKIIWKQHFSVFFFFLNVDEATANFLPNLKGPYVSFAFDKPAKMYR